MNILSHCPLFQKIPVQELEQILSCLQATTKEFEAGTFLLQAGDPIHEIGIVIEGRVQIIQEDFSGNRTIVTELIPGDLFAEAFACSSHAQAIAPISVFCVKRSSALFFSYQKLLEYSASESPHYAQLIENMISVLADKNLLLNRRIRHLTKRTTRDKLLSFLSEQAMFHNCFEFSIPFNRQELADYLCVERSAMSAVLSSLCKQGLLEYSRNHFRLNPKGNFFHTY